MSRELTRHVHLHHEGTTFSFAPGDTLPEWAEAKVSNPDALFEPLAAGGVVAKADAPIVGDSGPVEPPRGGPKATKEAWAQYAASLGVDFGPDASRDEIIRLLDLR